MKPCPECDGSKVAISFEISHYGQSLIAICCSCGFRISIKIGYSPTNMDLVKLAKLWDECQVARRMFRKGGEITTKLLKKNYVEFDLSDPKHASTESTISIEDSDGNTVASIWTRL